MRDDTSRGQAGRPDRRGRFSGHHGEWGDGHGGHVGGPRRRGRRLRDVRGAILALLAERPMHGYEMLQELGERTQGMWRPSPGSLYPALQLLEDQGIVTSELAEGRRQYALTDAGRAELAQGPATAPWDAVMRDADQGDLALRRSLRQLAKAVAQVADAGTEDQKARASRVMSDARRQIYLLLAETDERTAP